MITFTELVEALSVSSNFVSNTLWLILELSSFIGRNLVHQLMFIFNYVKEIYELINVLLTVVCEDLSIFFEDIREKCGCLVILSMNAVTASGHKISQISTIAVCAITKVFNFILCITDAITESISCSISLVKALVISLTNIVLLTGSSIWLAVTKFPVELLHLSAAVVEQIHNIIHGTKLLLLIICNSVAGTIQDIYEFTLSIPFGPVLGLILGVTTCYYIAKYFGRICVLTFEISVFIYHYISSFINCLWGRSSLSRGRGISHNVAYNSEDECSQDKLCVVCQDKWKEIIILPCRHVCLCLDCSLYINRNQRICPVCRSNIQTTMRVYL